MNDDLCSLEGRQRLPSWSLSSLSSSSSSSEPLDRNCFNSLLCENHLSPDVSTDDDDLQELSWLQKRHLLRELQPRGVGTLEPVVPSERDEHSVPSVRRRRRSPAVNVPTKPPYSFSCLIFMAIDEAPEKQLKVNDIYRWLMDRFAYFRDAPKGWKNSVRHNLSMNRCFQKVDKESRQTLSKGSLWCVDAAFRPSLLQLVAAQFNRTPCRLFQQRQALLERPLERFPPPSPPPLFPNHPPQLRTQDSSASSSSSAESVSESEVNAASTLLMLKRATDCADAKLRLKRAASPTEVSRSWKQVRSWTRTSTPRRTQPLQPSDGESHSSRDADESDIEECQDDEQLKVAESVDALLHLAGMKTSDTSSLRMLQGLSCIDSEDSIDL